MTAPGPPVTGALDEPPRPDSVRIAVELWFAVIVAQVISTVAQYWILRDESSRIMDEMSDRFDEPAPLSPSVLAIVSIAIGCVVLSAITLVAMKFFWDGRNWARQVLGVFSAFIAVQLVFTVLALFTDSDGTSLPAWGTVFGILGGVGAIGALVALMNRDTANYCRDMAVWRDRSRQNGGVGR